MPNQCYCVTRHDAPLEPMLNEIPEPTGEQVLIRMTGAGVCHSDIHIWEGKYDLGGGQQMTLADRGMKLPLTMGHEIAGQVVKAGPDAKGVSEGMNCLVYPWLGCGECSICQRDEENLCPVKTQSIGIFQPGGYAEYVLVPKAKYCIDIGDLDPAEMAPFACSGITTYSALRKFGDKIADEPVVIMGAGGLGHMALSMVQGMKGKGAVFVDLDPAKREAVLEAGALAAIDGGAEDAARQITEATGGGAHMVLDLVGTGATINLGLAAGTKGVQVVVVGLYGGEITVPTVYFPLRAMALRGSYVGNLKELRELVDLVKSGRVKSVPVTRRNLSEASDALMDLKNGNVIGRVVLVPQGTA